MTTLQLVHGNEYTVVENPLDQSPDHFRNFEVEPVLLGSQDLVRITGLLRDIDLIPVNIRVVDRTFSVLEGPFAESLIEDLIPLLRKASEEEVTKYMWENARGIYIWSIEFIDAKSPSSRLTIRQKGVVNASNVNVGVRLTEALNSKGFHG